jgi:hypothetical protein
MDADEVMRLSRSMPNEKVQSAIAAGDAAVRSWARRLREPIAASSLQAAQRVAIEVSLIFDGGLSLLAR